MTTPPLAGRRVVVTRPRPQAPSLCRLLADRGAEPLTFPAIAIVPAADGAPLDEAISRLDRYDWIVFTSVNGVETFFGRAGGRELPHRVRVAAIGPATARALEEYGASAAAVPEEHVAERIADVVGDPAGARFLLARAATARPDLADLLRARGGAVDDVAIYDTVAGSPTAEERAALEAGVDAVTFTSSSTVRCFLDLAPAARDWLREVTVACIGPITAATARECGVPVGVVAQTYTTGGLVQALVDHYSQPAAAS